MPPLHTLSRFSIQLPWATGANTDESSGKIRKGLGQKYRVTSPFATDLSSRASTSTSDTSRTSSIGSAKLLTRERGNVEGGQRGDQRRRSYSCTAAYAPIPEEESDNDVKGVESEGGAEDKEWGDAKRVVHLHKKDPKALLYLGSPLRVPRPDVPRDRVIVEGGRGGKGRGKEYRRQDKLLDYQPPTFQRFSSGGGGQTEEAAGRPMRAKGLAPADAGAAELMGLPSSLMMPYDSQQLRQQAADRYQQKLVRIRKAKIRLETYVDQVQIKSDSQGRAPVAKKPMYQVALGDQSMSPEKETEAAQDGHRLSVGQNEASRFGVGNIQKPDFYHEEHHQGAANNPGMQIYDGPGMDRKRLKVIERLEGEHLRQLQHEQMARARQDVKQVAVLERIFKDQEQRVSNQEKEEQRLRRREARVAQQRARHECESPVKLQQRKPFGRKEHESMDMRSVLMPHSGEEQGAGCCSGGQGTLHCARGETELS